VGLAGCGRSQIAGLGWAIRRRSLCLPRTAALLAGDDEGHLCRGRVIDVTSTGLVRSRRNVRRLMAGLPEICQRRCSVCHAYPRVAAWAEPVDLRERGGTDGEAQGFEVAARPWHARVRGSMTLPATAPRVAERACAHSKALGVYLRRHDEEVCSRGRPETAAKSSHGRGHRLGTCLAHQHKCIPALGP
jgi:hypothetical protein